MTADVEAAKFLAAGEFDQALENAIAFGVVEGVTQERRRIADILTSPEAEKRQGAAIRLALHDRRIASDVARKILADMPIVKRRDDDVIDLAAHRATFNKGN